MGRYPFEVVISGISGRFPDSRNVQEFKEKLFSKEMLLIPDEKRWNPVEHDEPFLTGKIPDVDKFDISFFGVPKRLGRCCDPVLGTTMEVSTEAMIDAGVNPYSVKGSNISVIVASTTTDAEVLKYFEGSFLDGQAMVGLARTMLANRISYTFNFTGPSYNVDSSWVSAVQGLEKAASIVGQGHVEAAIVTCVNLTFHNSFEREFTDIDNLISQSRKCSPFDAKADGFLRSEGTVSFYLQRAQDAKRNYCTVINSQTRCLNSHPSSFTSVNPFLETFLREFYTESKIDPKDVSYVETFGFCKKDRDTQELDAVEKVFCDKQKAPLLIGSGTGNYGNTETSSSFVSLTKAIIALEEDMIPPTINFTTPNPDISGLTNCRLKVVTESTKLPGSLVAVNSLNYTGNASHTLLRQHNKNKSALSDKSLRSKDGLPRLCILQARNEEGASSITKQVARKPLDPEFVSLVNGVFKVPVTHYLWRSFLVLHGPDGNTVSEIKELDPVKRPVWYVFSGMGSQWPGMGRDLLQIPTFAAAIDKCQQCLQPMGVDVKHILTANDSSIFDNILNCFVGITSIQIGLVDCLRSLGVTPDAMIGHSAGEIGCAYADGCLSLEETILSSYYRGKATLDDKTVQVKGMMAAIGLGYQDIKDKVPPNVDVACHNSADSCTVSGKAEDVLQYVEKLKRDGVLAKAVNVAGIAYHSRYIKTVAPRLLEYLKKVIKTRKPRSSKWICTSAPQSQWNTEVVRFCSPEYFTNNLLNPVFFEEGCKFIPKNATVIEIAPHGLLQSILRRSIGMECVSIPLTSRMAGSNLSFFLAAVGKLHLNNVSVDANALFPAVDYPVSRGTPPLSTLVTWDHEETRLTEFRTLVKTVVQKNTSERIVPVSSQAPDFELWREHRVDSKVVLPSMQLLMYPWSMIFIAKRLKLRNHAVVFEDVIFSEVVAVDETEHPLLVSFSPAGFYFEVSHEVPKTVTRQNIVTGKLREENVQPLLVPELDVETFMLGKVNSKEVYEVLSQYGIKLGPQFQVIRQINIKENECIAKIKWTSDVIVFVDALFKFLTYVKIEKDPSSMHHPTSFIKLVINKPLLDELPVNTVLDVHYDTRCNRLVCVAAELLGVVFKSTEHKKSDCLKWRELKFKPYFNSSISLKEFLSTSQQLAKEAGLGTWLEAPSSLHLLLVKPGNTEALPFYQRLVTVFHDHSHLYEKVSEVDVDTATDLLKCAGQQRYLLVGDQTTVSLLSETAASDRIYCITSLKGSQSLGPSIRTILSCNYQDGKLTLLKKSSTESPVVVTLEGKDWLERVRRAVKDLSNAQPVVLVTRTLEPRYVLPILAKESFSACVRTMFIQQANAPQYSNSSPTFSSQLKLGLPVNVLSEGLWGSLRSQEVDIYIKNNFNDFFGRADAGIDINFIGLNPPTFDKTLSLGLPALKCVDYSGSTEANQPVMGVAMLEGDSTPLILDPVLRWPVPSDFTMEDASTVPVLYGLACYCINIKAKVQPGETVLVHAGMSPIGQAVICMALIAEANVITFVENQEEEKFLRKRFPKLKPSHIIIRGIEDLDIPVKKLTSGRGVEVIVNCLRGREMQSTIKVMGTDCRFLHLGHISVEDRESIGMLVFLKRTSLHGITVENLSRCNEEEKMRIQRAVLEGIMKGDVKPTKRKTFSCFSQTEVLEFLKHKSIGEKALLCIKKESATCKSLSFDPEEFVVIAGTSSNLWLDVASWVLTHGGQHVVVLTTENMIAANNFHKIDKLITQPQTTFTLYPLSRFDNIQDGIDLLEELLQLRPIDTFLCINLDESSSRMRNLDIALRKAVPRLRKFVALLGQGAGVCEARARCGLHVCCIQKDTPISPPANVLPYLTTLLSDETSKAKFLIVSDFTARSSKSDMRISSTDVMGHLPQSVAELELLGLNLSQTQLQEIPSLSPRYEHVKHQLLPLFVIPGISSSRIEPLTRQLMYPVFCPTVPPSLPNVEQSATYLLQQIQAVREKGPYNLIGETWSGAMTLHLASLLEAQGHEVMVFLIDAAPSLSQARASVFRGPSGLFASSEFLSCTLGQHGHVLNDENQFTSWDEELDLATKYLQSTQQTSQESLDSIRKYLSALKMRLTDIMDYRFQEIQVNATVHLIQTRQYADSHLLDMSKCCHKRPQLHKIEDNTLREAIENPKTATIINENVIFTWKV